MGKMKMQVNGTLTVQQAFDQFQQYNRTKNLSPDTISYYNCYYRRLCEYLENTSIPIASINQTTVESYIRYLQQKGTMTDTTVNTAIRMVRAFLYFAMERGYLPSFKVKQIKSVQVLKEPYTAAELSLLLKKPDTKTCSFAQYRNWAIVSFLLATGCRASTLVNICIQDIDITNGMVRFRHMKNRTEQIVPLSKTIMQILGEYLHYRKGEPQDCLFVTCTGKPMRVCTLEDAVAYYNNSRGVNKTSIHLFRHTYAKLFIKGGGDPFRLQKLLSHSDLTMTKRYVALYAEDLKENYDKLNPLEQMMGGKGDRIGMGR